MPAIRRSMSLAVLIALAPLAHAQQSSQQSPPAPVGTETRAWTQLQRDDTAASTTPRPMNGDIAARVYERYANSYANPIPEQLGREGFVAEGGSE